MPAFKIASGDNDFMPLLQRSRATGKPILLSTGMADLGDDRRAANAVIEGVWQRADVDPGLVLLHCVSAYPTPPAEANLRAIRALPTPRRARSATPTTRSASTRRVARGRRSARASSRSTSRSTRRSPTSATTSCRPIRRSCGAGRARARGRGAAGRRRRSGSCRRKRPPPAPRGARSPPRATCRRAHRSPPQRPHLAAARRAALPPGEEAGCWSAAQLRRAVTARRADSSLDDRGLARCAASPATRDRARIEPSASTLPRADAPARAGRRTATLRITPAGRAARTLCCTAASRDHRSRSALQPAVRGRRRHARPTTASSTTTSSCARRWSAHGAQLRDRGDTEVLARLLAHDGAGGPRPLRGHVGVRRVRRERRRARCWRATASAKSRSTFYRDDDGGLYFGSELKFIFALLGRRAAGQRTTTSSATSSTATRRSTRVARRSSQGLEELPPATMLRVDAPDGEHGASRYWDAALRARRVDMSYEEAVAGTRERLIALGASCGCAPTCRSPSA